MRENYESRKNNYWLSTESYGFTKAAKKGTRMKAQIKNKPQ